MDSPDHEGRVEQERGVVERSIEPEYVNILIL